MKTKIIKIKMIEKELNQKELSKKLKVSNQTINNWINKRNTKNIEKFLKMMKELEIEVNDLI